MSWCNVVSPVQCSNRCSLIRHSPCRHTSSICQGLHQHVSQLQLHLPVSRQHVQTSKAAAAAEAAAGSGGQGHINSADFYLEDCPADVAPHVLLALDPIWFTNSSSSGSSAGDESSSANTHTAGSSQLYSSSGSSNSSGSQQWLIPRTRGRLQGMQQLPGYMPRLGSFTSEPQLVFHRQQALHAWKAAAAWVQQQQQQQVTLAPQQQWQPDAQSIHLQQQEVHQDLISWLQHSSGPKAHWASLAAVLESAGPWLQLQHLAAITQALANIAGSSSSSTMQADAGGVADVWRPAMLTISIASSKQAAARNSVTSSSSSSSSSRYFSGSDSSDDSSSNTKVVLKCANVLPKLTSLIQQQLQLLEEQQQQQQEPVDSSNAADSSGNSTIPSSSLHSSTAVQLLQHLAVLQSSSKLGAAQPDAVAALIACISVQECSLADLSGLLVSCARLGHPLRSSWLAAYTAAALEKLKEAVGAAAAAAATGAGVAGAADIAVAGCDGGDGRQLSAILPNLLDGLAMYPGPHIQPDQLQPLLEAAQQHMRAMTITQLHQLLTAVAALQLQPSHSWIDSAAAAACAKFPYASMQELVLLLQGVAAFSSGSAWQLDRAWCQAWFEASAGRCAGISLIASLTEDGSSSSFRGATYAFAGAAADGSNSSSGSSSDAVGIGASALFVAEAGDSADAAASSELAAEALQQWQGQQQQVEQVPAEVLCEVCVTLLEQQLQVHPLWLAGTLEAYYRSAYDAGSTPALLLLVAELLDSPQDFATRHKLLLQQLLQPLQERLSQLTAEQLTQAAQVCAVYNLKLGVEWFRWHAAAVLRLGKTYPLDGLAAVRDAYVQLEVEPEQRMQQLLNTLPWRLRRQAERQRQQQRLQQAKAQITMKNEQRRRQNEKDKAARERKKAAKVQGPGSVSAGGVGQDGRQEWRKRKLKPPGTLDRKF